MEHFSICEEVSPSSACATPDTYGDGNGVPTPVYLRFKKLPNFEARADSNRGQRLQRYSGGH